MPVKGLLGDENVECSEVKCDQGRLKKEGNETNDGNTCDNL